MVVTSVFFLFASILHLAAAQTTCSNYGTLSPTDSSQCICPAGFLSSTDCIQPQCGGNIVEGGSGTAVIAGAAGLGNVTTGCGCEDGWSGPVCSVCQSAQACSLVFPSTVNSTTTHSSAAIPLSQNENLTCSSSPVTYASSQLLCNVRNPTLQTVYPGVSQLGMTRTLNKGLSPVDGQNRSAGFGENGTIYAQLWYDGVEQFFCLAEQCNQTESTTLNSTSNTNVTSSLWTCPTLKCTCISNTTFCSQLGTVLGGLSGSLEVNCQSTGSCTFNQQLLRQLFPPSGLGLSDCQFGECVSYETVQRAEGIFTSAASGGGSSLSGGVVSGLAVVGAIVGLLLLLLVWGFIKQKKARKAVTMLEGEGLAMLGRKKGLGAGVVWNGIGYRLGRAAGIAGLLGGLGGRGQKSTEGKVILEGVEGKLSAGSLCCVLGPSGAGKSTFVDILGGRRKTGGKVEGKVQFFTSGNDSPVDGKVRHRVGFVDQEDVLNPTSTVRETLLFAARLRLPESIPESMKAERVFEVIQQLGLVDVADVRIGDGEKRGVSGGERRRVSIGVELVAAPDVLILDEPTSGLDSVSAAKVVSVLQKLAHDPDYPTTIIASIHQPSSRLYQSFDTCLLLSQGRQLYFGPGGSNPAHYFASKGLPCPENYNVADHLLEVASGSASSIQNLANSSARENSDDGSDPNMRTYTAMKEQVQSPSVTEKGGLDYGEDHTAVLNGGQSSSRSLITPTSAGSGQEDDVMAQESRISHKCPTTFLTQLEVLSGREWKNLQRDWSLLITHVVFACILGVFAGGLYFKVDLSIAGFQNRVGSLFFLGSLVAFSTLSALYNLVTVRPLFLRERAGSYYSPTAWLFSRLLFDIIPLRVIPTIIVSTIVYFMVGLSGEAARFFKCLLILVEYSLALTLFNFLLAGVIRNGGVAILLSSLHNLYLMTYAGFFVNLSKIPPVLRWLRWFDVLGYALEAMAVNEVQSGLEIVDVLAGVPVTVSASLIMETLFGFGLTHYYRDVLVLVAFIVGYGALLVATVWLFMREGR